MPESPAAASLISNVLLDSVYGTVPVPESWPQAWKTVTDYIGNTNGVAAFRRESGELAHVLATAGPHADIIQLCLRAPIDQYDRVAIARPGVLQALDAEESAFKVSVPVDDGFYVLGFGPLEPSASAESKLRLGRIVPHLERAIRASHVVTRERSTVATLLGNSPYSVFIVDHKGRVADMNERALRLSLQDSYVDLKDGLLHIHDASAASLLRSHLLEKTPDMSKSKVVFLRSRQGQTHGFLRVVPIATSPPSPLRCAAQHHAVLIAERSQLDDGETLDAWSTQSLFGLTAGECRVAAAAVYAPDINRMASILGLSRESVRWHLKNIYAKTRTSGIAELVSLIATGPLLLSDRAGD